ncbi:AcrR family transcriptional regulator [Lipingzhangella halophila]|uniref:AcrR family transcriptional regulator n=1 Tax=Lipingzhangella halophila TaxID=1783352 RepID=A0A7W7W3S3_9ACTN|nr:TetR/AcrR family transcriptional regulator C-terminal domain-containing protein [Lipingzhangella halophila]MBB4932099.1 AcrR family transcriptional regulator [Lipingzhangella halophila]
MPRPRSLTPTQIATAALAVADRDGLDGLSMRAVAQQLGMGTMSLYRYVTDRSQVEEVMVDLVLQGVDLSPPPGSPSARLGVLAERVRGAVLEHPAVVPLLITHRHRSPSSRRWGETMLGLLTEAGLTGERRVVAFRVILGYVLGAVQVEQFGPLDGTGTAALAGLPVEEFPLLAETAADARAIPSEAEFRRGFDIVLRGLGL